MSDLRYTLRALRRSPGLSLAIILVLTLGIAATGAMLSIVQAALLRPIPFQDPDRLVQIWETDKSEGFSRGAVAPANFLDWRARNRVFADLAPWRFWFFNISGGPEPERVQGLQVSANFLPLIGIRPAVGRGFTPADERPADVVILSHALWHRRFAGRPDTVGNTVTIDGRPRTIVGILGPDAQFIRVLNHDLELWVPFAIEEGEARRDDYSLNVYARLSSGVPVEQARADMEAIAAQLALEHPETNRDRGTAVVPLPELSAALRPLLMTLFAAVTIVLVIACANIAALMATRSARRASEFAVLSALGATRIRLLRLVLTESLVLSIAAGTAGVGLTGWSLKILNRVVPYTAVPRYGLFELDFRVTIATLAISITTGLLFGLIAALGPSVGERQSLRAPGTRATPSLAAGRLRQVLVLVEIALTVAMLVTAGLLIRTSIALARFDRGLTPDSILTLRLWLPEAKYRTGPQAIDFYDDVLVRLSALPGVATASVVNFLPLSRLWDSVALTLEGRPPVGDDLPSVRYHVVGSDYFRTMGIQVRQGRAFSRFDTRDAEGVVVVSAALARRYWPNEDPLGRRISLAFPAATAPWRPIPKAGWLTVVGVASDVREDGLVDSPSSVVYLPYTQHPTFIMSLVVRTTGDPASSSDAVRRTVWSVDPDQPPYDIKTMEQVVAEAGTDRQLLAWVIQAFALLGLTLAGVGLYGVVAAAVVDRTGEIGVRVALGAAPADVMRLVLFQAFGVTGLGIAAGLAGGALGGTLTARFLFGVTPVDLPTYASVTAIVLSVAIAASYFPAREAARLDPVAALSRAT